MNVQQMNALIDQEKEDLFQLLSNLIQINSENFNSYGNEAECAR